MIYWTGWMDIFGRKYIAIFFEDETRNDIRGQLSIKVFLKLFLVHRIIFQKSLLKMWLVKYTNS